MVPDIEQHSEPEARIRELETENAALREWLRSLRRDLYAQPHKQIDAYLAKHFPMLPESDGDSHG